MMLVAINHRNSINRENRKVRARVLKLLGFELNEIVADLGVSSPTVKTYLSETTGVVYSDLGKLAYRWDILRLFTEEEQELLNYFKWADRETKKLSSKKNRFKLIAQGKGLRGWIHKKIFKNCAEYSKKEKSVSKELRLLLKEVKIRLKSLKSSKICPHLSKSAIAFEIVVNG